MKLRPDGTLLGTTVVDVSRDPALGTDADETARQTYLETARARFQECISAEDTLRRNMLEDKLFRKGEQWPESAKRLRESEGRPCLTVNRLPQFIRQITNQQRENRVSIRVSARDSLSDPQTASVIQALVDQIQYESQAQAAYMTACDDQVTMGRGWIRVLTDFAHPNDRHQTPVIKRIRNAFSVYLDPAHEQLDGSDALYGFVVRDFRPAEYDARFGKQDGERISAEMFNAIGNQKAQWFLDGSVRVAEYYTVTFEPDTLLVLETDDDVLLSTVPTRNVARDEMDQKTIVGILVGERPVRVTAQRPTTRPVVRWSIIDGIHILDGNEARTDGKVILGTRVPLFPVIGEEVDVNGEVDLRGIVRDAKEPQRRYNYCVSAAVEVAALKPKSPWLVVEGQDEGYEAQWATANIVNYSMLKYKPVIAGGQLAHPPHRNVGGPEIGDLVALTTQASMDLMNVIGRYQASLGASGPEQSGKAIMARQRAGDIGSYNFQDNLNYAIASVGRYLVDIIPACYDVTQIVRILGEDGQAKAVMLHNNDQSAPQAPPEGVEGIYNVGVGRFDVTVSTGPSYPSRRAEFTEMAMELTRAYPAAGALLFPYIVRNMDLPYAGEISAALMKAIPPEMRPDEPGKPAAADPEVEKKMQAMTLMVQKLQGELAQAQAIIQQKVIENISEERQAAIAAQSREKVAIINRDAVLRKAGLEGETDIAIGQMKSITADHTARLKALATPPAPSQEGMAGV